MATAPYKVGNRWTIDKDPDDQRYYVANIAADLTDSGTTASSVTAIVQGVSVLEDPAIQNGNLIVVKLGGMGAAGTDSFCTLRVTCANSERFDRTIYFNQVDN